MATASFHGLRRFLASILMFGLFGAGLAQMAAAQGTPQVTSSYVTALTHPSGWGQIVSTAITGDGDLLVEETNNGALYEFPANGGAMITLIASGMGANAGGQWNPSVALDSQNNLYLTGNWDNCVSRIPYDPATKTWPDLALVAQTTLAPNGGNCVDAVFQYNLSGEWADGAWGAQPFALGTDANNNLYLSTFNWNNGFLLELPLAVKNGALSVGAPITFLDHLGASSGSNVDSIAIDPWGNIYFVETGQNKVLEYPAGQAFTPGQAESGLPRVDPELTYIEGVQPDAAGNLYISDAQAGVVMVPAAKGPGLQPQTAAAVYLSPVAGLGSVSIDFARNILYVPTKPKSWNGWNGFYDVVAVNLNNAELGSTPVGTPVTSTIYYDFSGSVTPASIAIEEAGVTAADFSVATGGSCQAGTAYTAGQNCTVNVSLNPQVAGNVSAKLVMRDNAGNTLLSTVLHGTGQAPMLAISPAAESTIGSGLQTPSQVAVDAAGNAYVADAGLGAVVEYPVSSGATTPTNIGTGLKNPTGVAVNGAGDVFIADAGNVYEVPNTASGLNSTAQITLKSGLGANLNLAVDGLGDLFIADPANQRVVKLSNPGGTFPTMAQTESDLTGLNAPSLVATDASGNLYVVDGVNLIQITPVGQQTTITNTVSNATGLAVDASGALYIAAPSASMRIPWVNGAWAVGSPVTIAASVSNPKGIALDSGGDLFTADATAENIHVYGASGELNFGTLTLGQTPSLEAALTNQGNEPMDITGFTVSNAVDYSASGTACTASALPQGTNCDLTVTLSPGPGDQGTLSTQIQIQGNQANSATLLSAIGVGASLAKSVTTVSVASSASVVDVPVTVTVSPASGTGTPTGDVTVSVDGANPTTKALSNGTVKFDFMPISAGSHTFSVTYQGDRAFGSSTASTTATVAKGAVTMSEPAPPKYVLSNGESYGDQNTTQYYFTYKMQVNASAGTPTGTVTFMEGTTAACDSSPAKMDANGYATFTTTCLTLPTSTNPTTLVATHVLTPVYSGDANYQSFTGSAVTFNVIRNPSVTLASSPAAVTVSSGSTAAANITLTSLLGYGIAGLNEPILNYTLPLALQCNGLPAHTTCSFSSSSITVTPTVPGAATMTIQTNVAVQPTSSVTKSSQRRIIRHAALFGFGFLGLLFTRRKKIRTYLTPLCVLALAIALAGISGCSTSSFKQSTDSLQTPKGTYTISVTAIQVGSTVVPGSNGSQQTIYGSNNQISLPFTMTLTVQ